MASPRIKGQEVEIITIAGGVPQSTITTVRDFEMTFQTEVLREGYLNETTDRRDTIFRGIKGKFMLHLENSDIFNLIQVIIDTARRRTPGVQINIKATLRFPNGDRPRIVIPAAEFGELPLNVGSRSDYVSQTIDFEASEAQVIQ